VADAFNPFLSEHFPSLHLQFAVAKNLPLRPDGNFAV
jgi:hypothetical protein